jgi:uncharacterized protein YggU (UPF0235/DUF167 family)
MRRLGPIRKVPDRGRRVTQVLVRAHPRSSRDGVGPYRDGILHLRSTRPAADGEANVALRRLLAEALDVAPSAVRLVSGERGRDKRYEIDGISREAVGARLAVFDPAVGPPD